MVGGPTFGRLWKTSLPLAPADQVFAQPLVMGGTVFVATEGNNLYALDAESGSIKASRALGPAWRAADIGCSDLKPYVGITGTPVIDTATRTAYLFSKRYLDDRPSPAPENTVWYAHAVDVDTLAERPNFPVRIQGTASNDPNIRFGAFAQLQRPALLLMNGVVYAGFGGHCDAPTFRGWVVGVGIDGQIKTLFTAEVYEKGGAGIWQSGGGLVSDGPGRIFFVTGNGFLDADNTPQAQPTGHLSQSVVRLQVQGDGSLRAMDFFAPYNRSTLDLADTDFGSGAPVALPSEYFGTTTHPRLMVASGKAGVLYLLDREDLGGFRQGSGGGDDVLAGVNAAAGMWSRPAVYPPAGLVYVVSNSQPMQAFRYGVGADGRPTLSEAGRTPNPFGYTSGSPIVTSDGTRAGSALVWVTFSTSTYGDAQLRAYDAVPDPAGTLNLRFMDGYGVHAKFSVPGVGAGRIYVGTADGHVLGYGAPITNPVSSAPLDFGAVVVGKAAARDAVITANQPVTITGVTVASGDFTLGTPMPALPAPLVPGNTLTVPVQFAPTAAALRAATIEVTTSGGPVSIPVQGRGEAPAAMLTATPSTISFGGLARGRDRVVNVVLGNAGAQPLTWQSYTAPSAPFSVGTLPAVGTTLAPGQQLPVALTFAPTAVGSFTGSLVVGSTGGAVTVYLAGSAGEPPALSVMPATLDFGTVVSGESATRSFTVRNAGGADLTITKSKAPGGGTFLARSPLDEGTVIAPGTARTLMVAFLPTSPGPAQDQWQITGDDASGMQVVTFNGVGQTWQDGGAPAADGPAGPPPAIDTPVVSADAPVAPDSGADAGTAAETAAGPRRPWTSLSSAAPTAAAAPWAANLEATRPPSGWCPSALLAIARRRRSLSSPGGPPTVRG